MFICFLLLEPNYVLLPCNRTSYNDVTCFRQGVFCACLYTPLHVHVQQQPVCSLPSFQISHKIDNFSCSCSFLVRSSYLDLYNDEYCLALNPHKCRPQVFLLTSSVNFLIMWRYVNRLWVAFHTTELMTFVSVDAQNNA